MSSSFFAIDPGNELSAFVVYNPTTGLPVRWGKVSNQELFNEIVIRGLPVVCEFPYPRGQGVSWQTLETCETYGEIKQIAKEAGLSVTKMNRHDVKMLLCRSSRAKDGDVRKALIARYGGECAITGGKCPDCLGKGSNGFRKDPQACSHCFATGQVDGAKRPKQCPKCKGDRQIYVKTPIKCLRCSGTCVLPPGVLHGISADVWQALAVAVTYATMGPSKSARVLQDERKIRKADQKLQQIDRLAKMRADLEELKTKPWKTQKQFDALQKRQSSLEKNIAKLALKCTTK